MVAETKAERGRIFDTKGEVAFVLGLSGFSGERRGAEVESIVDRPRKLCAGVAEFVPS